MFEVTNKNTKLESYISLKLTIGTKTTSINVVHASVLPSSYVLKNKVFYLLFGCSIANFVPLLRGQPNLPMLITAFPQFSTRRSSGAS